MGREADPPRRKARWRRGDAAGDPRASLAARREMVAARRDSLRREPAPHGNGQTPQDRATRTISRLSVVERGLTASPSAGWGGGPPARWWRGSGRGLGFLAPETPNPQPCRPFQHA